MFKFFISALLGTCFLLTGLGVIRTIGFKKITQKKTNFAQITSSEYVPSEPVNPPHQNPYSEPIVEVIDDDPPAEQIYQNPVEVEEIDGENQPAVQALGIDQVKFSLIVNDYEQDAKTAAETINELNDYINEHDSSIRVKIILPKELVAQHKDEKVFRRWLARVGDYIFVRRLEITDDWANILRNKDGLLRSAPSKIHERGCVLLSDNDKDWHIMLRGFENHALELITVIENILVPAFSQTKNMADCPPLKTKKMSDALKDFHHKMSGNTIQLIDHYINKCVVSRDMDIKINLTAFLPLTDFVELNSIENNEKEIIVAANEVFFNKFWQLMENNNVTKLKATPANLDNLIKASYVQTIDLYKIWLQESQLSSFLLKSLFEKHE
ncbi:MAG: hypothetical protein KC505_10520 [Myxococcales bacterium]|nr:hypothetical protein [Myxococcales bacterium]USN51311.1 MAG: hypothetical protein H6731_02585 [Myxococcales bacterium]